MILGYTFSEPATAPAPTCTTGTCASATEPMTATFATTAAGGDQGMTAVLIGIILLIIIEEFF